MLTEGGLLSIGAKGRFLRLKSLDSSFPIDCLTVNAISKLVSC